MGGWSPVLDPVQLLESKCVAIATRSNDSKRKNDRRDIIYLLEHMVKNNITTTPEQVPSATEPFKAYFRLNGEGTSHLWTSVGL